MPRVNVKDKRKQQLMEANMTSIAKRGLADTTIAHVSKGASMSRGIVNFYFTSKEKMMLETLTFLAEESTVLWREALAAAKLESDDPLAHISAILQALMGDKLCSNKRLSVWSSFIGHAGTHAGYARIIRSMDDALIKEFKDLGKKSGLAGDEAERRACQAIALIRGHYFLSVLSVTDRKPSAYQADYSLLWGASQPEPKTKAESASAKPKKPAAKPAPRQMDIADLFS
jgi:TetR/AcrR family transcriptional repressor of bet genes